jgi:hypothetical protein
VFFIVGETTSELESHDLVDHVICRYRKHRQFAHQVGGFVACSALNVSMVHPSMLIVTNDGEHLTCNGISLGETIHFGRLEFIADCFGSLSFSPKGNDSCTVFMGMACSGSPSWRSILEDSTDEFYTAYSREGSSGFPISRRHSLGTPPAPIETTPWPKDALTPQTMVTVQLWTLTPW